MFREIDSRLFSSLEIPLWAGGSPAGCWKTTSRSSTAIRGVEPGYLNDAVSYHALSALAMPPAPAVCAAWLAPPLTLSKRNPSARTSWRSYCQSRPCSPRRREHVTCRPGERSKRVPRGVSERRASNRSETGGVVRVGTPWAPGWALTPHSSATEQNAMTLDRASNLDR